MAGAYVAKPAAEVPVDYPPNWNPLWPFPGPLPPGFEWDWDEEDLPEEEEDEDGYPIPRIWVSSTGGLHTNEHDEGWSQEVGASFWVCLTSEPRRGSITVPFVVSNSDIGYCDPTSYTFSDGHDAAWSTPRLVRLIGRNDEVIDGDVEYGVTVGPSSSSAAAYAGLYGNQGNALDVTSYEVVDTILAYVDEVSANVGGSSSSEDYVIVSIAIYETSTGVTSLEDVVKEGTVIAKRSAQYHYDDSISYYGDSTPYPGIPLAIEASGLDSSLKYWIVSSIDLVGPIGTSSASCASCRMFFKHGDIEFEDYQKTDAQTGTFGKKNYKCWAVLDNSDSEAETKLNKTVASYEHDYIQALDDTEIIPTDFELSPATALWSYGADTAQAGALVLHEVSDAFVGGWSSLLGRTVSSEDSIKKRFWVWTRWPEYGAWALTTVGIINADGTAGQAIGSWDAVGQWSSTPRTGNDEQGTWWVLELLQPPRQDSESTSSTKPITGQIDWRASECVGTITSSYTWFRAETEPHVWAVALAVAVSGSIYDAVTDTTTVVDYTTTTGAFPPTPSEIDDAGGTLVVALDIDTSSEASTSSLSLGGDDIKTWDYYAT